MYKTDPPTTIILFTVAGIIQANFWSTLRLIILQGCLGLHKDSRIISRNSQDVLQRGRRYRWFTIFQFGRFKVMFL